ncbi:hypothetical protein GGX14DRAFT_409125 [Mycena pura]|uniref:Uncharacterized protein n=1 Tax=Mycena pura TaxID=153505 RepID=A0AAD6UJR7_9AGAR|nr:hypothetical protein GGX14DRAFT_409125 [Mycena pura]
MARQIIPEFFALDFYRMLPKITIKTREAMFSAPEETNATLKATAAGYHHTNFSTSSLWELLGLVPEDIRGQPRLQAGLPSIREWCPDFPEGEGLDTAEAEEWRHFPLWFLRTTQQLDGLANAALALKLHHQEIIIEVLRLNHLFTAAAIERSPLSGFSLDQFVELRERHQTKFVACAVHVTATRSTGAISRAKPADAAASGTGKAIVTKQIAEAFRDRRVVVLQPGPIFPKRKLCRAGKLSSRVQLEWCQDTSIIIVTGVYHVTLAQRLRRSTSLVLPAGNAHNAAAQATKLQWKRARVWLKVGRKPGDDKVPDTAVQCRASAVRRALTATKLLYEPYFILRP